MVSGVLKQLHGDVKMMEMFTTRIMEIYFRRKLEGEVLRNTLEKGLCFVLSEIDLIYEEGCVEELVVIRIILNKLLKRNVHKDAVKRVYQFLKGKPEPPRMKEVYKGLLVTLEKATKGPLVANGEEEGEEE